MVRCAFLTQGPLIPSSRFRVEQYQPLLKDLGIDPLVLHSRFGAYPPSTRFLRPIWGVAALLDGYSRVSAANACDVVLLQRELLSTVFSAERYLKRPFVFDVDDAIFLNARRQSIQKIASSAKSIIVGNTYLADYFSQFGEVVIIPTSVDCEYFSPGNANQLELVLGWSGSSSGLKYLYDIETALSVVMERYPFVCLKVVSNQPPQFKCLPKSRVYFEQWSQPREVDALREFSIGLMPLLDTPWERGKCSFKMLTYMSVGKPVVVSPVGMNLELLKMAHLGFGASYHDEWVEALCILIEDETLRLTLGKNGRETAVRFFDTRMQARRLSEVLIKSAS